jgi:hypothetical protein
VRVLFSTQPATGLLNHETVIRALVARGHDVTIAVHGDVDDPLLQRLSADLPSLHVEAALPPAGDRWLALAADVRSCLDLVLFAEPRFTETYRARSWRRAPRPFRLLARTGALRLRPVRAIVRRALEQVERALPASPVLERYLAGRQPDVVLFTPYVGLRTLQADYLRAAQALGLRSAICVKSWDNLTSKAALRPIPDRVIVWNETQRREAVELHGVPSARVAVTGAQCFDRWFDARPTPREAFLRRVGLDAAVPLVLYTCCAPWTGLREQPFVRRWLAALRAAPDPVVAGAAVLVRPHPKRPDEWHDADLGADVAVWPPVGAVPDQDDAWQDYVDSLHHCAAVVGLNTTAMLEAGLAGRPVLTVLDPEYRKVQEGTLHFRYMLEVAGGLVHVAPSLDAHVEQLADAIHGRLDPGPARAFVGTFLRPLGERRPTEAFVDEVERLGDEAPPDPIRASALLRGLRLILTPLATRAAHVA